MKSFKGVFVKTFKIIPTINSWRKFPFACNPLQHSFHHQNRHTQPVYKDQDCKFNINIPEQVVDSKDQKGKETDLDVDVGPQETNKLSTKNEAKETVVKEDHSQLPVSSNSNSNSNTVVKDETVSEIVEVESEEHPCLNDFESRCPPGGEDSVVLYTTSLRGIRKTFEDCRSIRYLLNSFKILIHERDVSMDMEFREELWRLFGERVVPPKLFIKGRYIGGADEVIGLHEEGKLKKLLKGIPLINIPCRDCANMRFLVCPNCDGSRKIFAETRYDDEQCLQCPECNENGLVKCPICS